MTMKKAKIAVLVSGGGTNLQALLDAQAAGLLPHGEIALVVSSNEGAYALTRAANAGVPAETVSPKRCGGQAAFESALSDLLAAHEIDLIVLAGFLTILSADFTARTCKTAYIRDEHHERIQHIVHIIGKNKITLSGYIDNVLAEHFASHKDEMTKLYELSKPIF